MQVSWAGAGIVVPAQNHNPSIVSPDWLRRNGIVDDPPVNFAHTPLFALYQSESMQVLVQPERLDVSLRVVSEASLERLAAAARRYVEVLEHVPYQAVGINFVWNGVSDAAAEFERLAGVAPDSAVRTVLRDGELRRGLLLEQVLSDYRLRILGEPQLDGKLKLDFNFHFQASGVAAVVAALNQSRRCFEESRRVAQLFLTQGVNA